MLCGVVLSGGVPSLQDLGPGTARGGAADVTITGTERTASMVLLHQPETTLTHLGGKVVLHETGPWCQKGWGPQL